MLADELKRLFERNLQTNVQLLGRAGNVLREAASAARDPQRLRGADARALLGELLQLQIDYLKGLSESSAQYLGSVVALAESAVAPRTPPADPSAQASALAGRVGDIVAFQFQLDNPNAEAVSAAIETREWLGRGGLTIASDSMLFEPAATVVDPGGRRLVQGRITIDERFAAGETYDTVIRIAGFPGRQIALSLTVLSAG
jgi:hypothetical protein